jgi:hypothetical protein
VLTALCRLPDAATLSVHQGPEHSRCEGGRWAAFSVLEPQWGRALDVLSRTLDHPVAASRVRTLLGS